MTRAFKAFLHLTIGRRRTCYQHSSCLLLRSLLSSNSLTSCKAGPALLESFSFSPARGFDELKTIFQNMF